MLFRGSSVRITPSSGQAVYVYPNDGGPSVEGSYVQAVVVGTTVMAVVDIEPHRLGGSGLFTSRILVDLSALQLSTMDETVEVQT